MTVTPADWPNVTLEVFDEQECGSFTQYLQGLAAGTDSMSLADLVALIPKLRKIVDANCEQLTLENLFATRLHLQCELQCFDLLEEIARRLASSGESIAGLTENALFLSHFFGSCLSAFRQIKLYINDSSLDTSLLIDELPELDMIWKKVYRLHPVGLSLLDKAFQLSGNSPAVYVDVVRSLLPLVEFAASEHELQILNSTWKHTFRIFRIIWADSKLVLEIDIFCILRNCYASHMRKLQEVSPTDMKIRCGVANWYMSKLHNVLRCHAYSAIVERLAPITDAVYLTWYQRIGFFQCAVFIAQSSKLIPANYSVILYQAESITIPYCGQLRQSLGGLLNSLCQLPNCDDASKLTLARGLLYKAEDALRGTVLFDFTSAHFNCARLTIFSFVLRYVDFVDPFTQSEFLKGGRKEPESSGLMTSLYRALAKDDPYNVIRAYGNQRSAYLDLLVSMGVFLHTLNGTAFTVLEMQLFTQLLAPESLICVLFTGDVFALVKRDGPPEIVERWNKLLRKLLLQVQENMSTRIYVKWIIHRMRTEIAPREMGISILPSEASMDDFQATAFLRFWTCDGHTAIQTLREVGLPLADLWDHLCQQLEDDDQQKVLRCFQALRLPAECLKSIVHGIETKDLDPELKELLEDVTQVLPTLVEGSQTAVQLAMSNGEPETVTWQIVNTIATVIRDATSVRPVAKSENLLSLLGALGGHTSLDLIPEVIVADFLAAIGPIVTKEAQLCVSKLLQSQLADKHWVVVHTALSSVFRYSSTSRIAVPAFPPTSRELMVGFIQNMPFKVGLGESQEGYYYPHKAISPSPFAKNPLRQVGLYKAYPPFLRKAVSISAEASPVANVIDAFHTMIHEEGYAHLLRHRSKLVEIAQRLQSMLNSS